MNARRREDYAADPTRVRIGNRQNYLKHRESRIEYALKYQKSNPHMVARIRHKRRGAEYRDVSAQDLQRLRMRHRGCCAYCKVALRPIGREFADSLQWDHIVPLSRGGRHSVGNLVPSCRSCNLSKGAKLLMEWKLTALT